jgi:serine/threonine-protein kinase SRPK3
MSFNEDSSEKSLDLSSINTDSEDSVFNIDLTGDIINNYNVIIELGHGSYSIVWLVYSISDMKYYAMKVQNPSDYEDGLEEINILKKISKDEKYINTLKDYFIEKRVINNQKMNFICSIYELCCGNLDALARKGKYKNGYPINIVKKMVKQICMGLKTIHLKLNGFHGDIKPDNILLLGINDRDLKYIENYNKANFNSKYDLEKKRYLNETKKSKISSEKKMQIKKSIHQDIINNLPKIDNSQYNFNNKYIENPSIRITDFGFYCNNDEKFNTSFGTQYYQAPEMILDGDCNSQVDIWALGCMIYEFITGELLFDPPDDNINFIHLNMMQNLCGNFDKKYLSTTKNSNKYFNKMGKLNEILVKEDSLNIKKRLANHSITDASLIDLLEKILILDPKIRINITSILNHQWLSN